MVHLTPATEAEEKPRKALPVAERAKNSEEAEERESRSYERNKNLLVAPGLTTRSDRTLRTGLLASLRTEHSY